MAGTLSSTVGKLRLRRVAFTVDPSLRSGGIVRALALCLYLQPLDSRELGAKMIFGGSEMLKAVDQMMASSRRSSRNECTKEESRECSEEDILLTQQAESH